MQITLIRHLPTEWNKQQKLQGRRDISLAEVSTDDLRRIEQNKLLLNSLAPFDIVLASTLIRTHQTARLYGYEPETESLLDELDFGRFEGKSKQELIQAFGDQWKEHPRNVVLGESLLNLEERVVSFLEKYKETTNLLIFGHGSWIRAMVSYWQNGDISQMNNIIVNNNQCIILT